MILVCNMRPRSHTRAHMHTYKLCTDEHITRNNNSISVRVLCTQLHKPQCMYMCVQYTTQTHILIAQIYLCFNDTRGEKTCANRQNNF